MHLGWISKSGRCCEATKKCVSTCGESCTLEKSSLGTQSYLFILANPHLMSHEANSVVIKNDLWQLNKSTAVTQSDDVSSLQEST